jgi:hypothetical protein
MKPPNGRRNAKLILFAAFIIAAIILGTLMLLKYNRSQQIPVSHVPPQETGVMRISLFFAAPDGKGLARETRDIDSCGDDLSACVQDVIEELVNGPLGDLAPTLPDATIVNSVQLNGDTAIVDFNNELVNGLPGGSSSEVTAVYSIVDTVSFNFPRIKRVKFLLDGHDADTLKGHLDLRIPIEPDFPQEKIKNNQAVAPEK